MECIGSLSSGHAESIIRFVAGYHGKEATYNQPIVEGEFPLDGSRFAGQMPPVVNSCTFAIRKRAIAVFTLDEYVSAGIMSRQYFDPISDAIQNRRNTLVAGGTGRGKTTLGLGLVDHSQKMTVAARATAEKKTAGHRS